MITNQERAALRSRRLWPARGRLPLGFLRLAAAAGMWLGLILSTRGANVILVGGTDAPDTDFVAFLEGLGHTVTLNAYVAGPPTPAELAGVDLVLVSRSANSGNYDEGTEAANWNALDVPLLMMNPYFTRGATSGTGGNRRWGWFNTLTVTNAAPGIENFDPYPDPNHPFVAGLGTNVYPPGETLDYINASAAAANLPTGATIVATTTIAGTAWASIVDIPAGTTLFGDTQATVTTTTNQRVLFQMHDYSDNDDMFTLSTNGQALLGQVIDVMTSGGGPVCDLGDVNCDGVVDLENDFEAIRMNFRDSVTMRSEGDLVRNNIVDFDDFHEWKTAFLSGGGSLEGLNLSFLMNVPEPSAACVMLLGILALFGTRNGRRRNSRLAVPA